MVVALLYAMQSPYNCFYFIAKALVIVVEVIDDETTSRRHDDGDHGVMPVTTMIMKPRRWRSKGANDIGHIMSLFDCM